MTALSICPKPAIPACPFLLSGFSASFVGNGIDPVPTTGGAGLIRVLGVLADGSGTSFETFVLGPRRQQRPAELQQLYVELCPHTAARGDLLCLPVRRAGRLRRRVLEQQGPVRARRHRGVGGARARHLGHGAGRPGRTGLRAPAPPGPRRLIAFRSSSDHPRNRTHAQTQTPGACRAGPRIDAGRRCPCPGPQDLYRAIEGRARRQLQGRRQRSRRHGRRPPASPTMRTAPKSSPT